MKLFVYPSRIQLDTAYYNASKLLTNYARTRWCKRSESTSKEVVGKTHIFPHTRTQCILAPNTLTLSWFYTFWYMLHIFLFQNTRSDKKNMTSTPSQHTIQLITFDQSFWNICFRLKEWNHQHHMHDILQMSYFNHTSTGMISRIQQKTCKFLWAVSRFSAEPVLLIVWKNPQKALKIFNFKSRIMMDHVCWNPRFMFSTGKEQSQGSEQILCLFHWQESVIFRPWNRSQIQRTVDPMRKRCETKWTIHISVIWFKYEQVLYWHEHEALMLSKINLWNVVLVRLVHWLSSLVICSGQR